MVTSHLLPGEKQEAVHQDSSMHVWTSVILASPESEPQSSAVGREVFKSFVLVDVFFEPETELQWI